MHERLPFASMRARARETRVRAGAACVFLSGEAGISGMRTGAEVVIVYCCFQLTAATRCCVQRVAARGTLTPRATLKELLLQTLLKTLNALLPSPENSLPRVAAVS
jgi:hypothetical protein